MLKHFAYVAIAAFLLYLFRENLKGGWCTSTDRIDGKIVIVTGGNAGIGFETALELAARGGKVYLACRSLDSGTAAANNIKKKLQLDDNRIVVLPLNLSSLQSVRKFAQEFRARETCLNILVNNAGAGASPRTLSEDGIELTFATNHLGHFLLTHLLMDLLVAGVPSRVVTVSSGTHDQGDLDFGDINLEQSYSAFSAYGRSKLANILFSAELARLTEGSGITTYSLHPGVIITSLFDSGLQAIVGDGLLYQLIFAVATPFTKTAVQGAQTSICCALDKQLENTTGKYYKDCVETLPHRKALDEEVGKQLWRVSVNLVHLQDDEIHPLLK